MSDTQSTFGLHSEEETERRREAALKRMLATPPKPRTATKRKGKESSQSD